MQRAATILVLGDPGPFRKELLIHREIELLWAGDVDGAVEILRTTGVDACIVGPECRGDVHRLRRWLIAVPCIALVAEGQAREPQGFSSIVEVEEVASLVELLGEQTGLRFARFPRADLVVPVAVKHAGRLHLLETVDVSVTGVGIKRFPAAQVGTCVEIVLELGARSLALPAQVVRWFDHDGERSAGVTFLEISEDQREAITRAVRRTLQWQPQQRLTEEALFGDLSLEDVPAKALDTRDLMATPMPAFVCRTDDLEMPALRALLQGEHDHGAPGWLAAFSQQVTAVESAVALDRTCPPWAGDVLRLRLRIAQARAIAPRAKLPSGMLDEAYKLFEHLRDEARGQSGTITAQIARIRAALLREIVSSRPRLLALPPAVARPKSAPLSLRAFR